MRLIVIVLLCMTFLCGCGGMSGGTAAPVTEAPTPTQTAVATSSPAPTAAPILSPTPDPNSLDVPSGDSAGVFTSESVGDYLDYHIFVPASPLKELPLIVYLHGDGEVGRPDALPDCGIVTRLREIYGEDFPFILLMPNTRVTSWVGESTAATLKELMDSVVSEYCIDPERVIITGHSRGAEGVWGLVNEYGDYFSAAVPVSCCQNGMVAVDSYTDVPLWALVGGGEDFELFGVIMSGNVGMINLAGGKAQFTCLDGSTHISMAYDAYTPELFDWMLSQ